MKTKTLLVCADNSSRSVKEELDRLTSIVNEHNPDTIVFGEFNFNAIQITDGLGDFREFAKKHGCNIVLAGRNETKVDNKTVFHSWSEICDKFRQKGVEVEEVPQEYLDKLGDQSYYKLPKGEHFIDVSGVWIGKDGDTLAFAKQNWFKGVHRIPSTTIGVSICNEIEQVTPEDTNGLHIIYNPAREADARYITGKTIHAAGAHVEDFIKPGAYEVTRDIYDQSVSKPVFGQAHLSDSVVLIIRSDLPRGTGLLNPNKHNTVNQFTPVEGGYVLEVEAIIQKTQIKPNMLEMLPVDSIESIPRNEQRPLKKIKN